MVFRNLHGSFRKNQQLRHKTRKPHKFTSKQNPGFRSQYHSAEHTCPLSPHAIESRVGSLSWPAKAGQGCQAAGVCCKAREARHVEQGQSRADIQPCRRGGGPGSPGVGETGSRLGAGHAAPSASCGRRLGAPPLAEHLCLVLGRDVARPLVKGSDQLLAMKSTTACRQKASGS